MRIFLHDYAGHPFQVDLSRALVRRGHEVTHAYFGGDMGPKGNFTAQPEDGEKLKFAAIGISGAYDKASFVSRRFKDIEYGRNVAQHIRRERPDVVISGNTPTEAQAPILRMAGQVDAAFVYWVQDFYSIAATRLLTAKLGFIGALVGTYYRWMERKQFRASDAIVLISDDFRAQAAAWADDAAKLVTIENWGPLEEISPLAKNNDWSRANGLEASFVFLYSGTLALKHNPDFLLQLARRWKDAAAVKVVVVGHGVGVDRLRASKLSEGLDNLIILPLQPIQRLAEVFASADVLIALLEPDAGAFSVPSKVQSYLCASRPIVLAAHAGNLAAKVLAQQSAGLVVPPDSPDAFLSAADKFYADESLRARYAANGRAYAERAYDIEAVASKFEKVVVDSRRRHTGHGRAGA